MAEQPERGPEREPKGGRGQQRPEVLTEALRSAVERTLAATAAPATETRQRAQELLDEVTRRGQAAREVVARRGADAREASAVARGKVRSAISDLRTPTRGEVDALLDRIDSLERRVAALEDQPQPRVEDEADLGESSDR